MEPAFQTHDGEYVTPWAGIYQPGATPASDIALRQTKIRIDGGPWQDGQRPPFSTWQLGDGDHLIEVRADLGEGCYATQPIAFNTVNRIEPLNAWQPVPDQSSPGRTASAWQSILDSQNRGWNALT